MNWLIRTLNATIGRKLFMAGTGLSFFLFLILHLSGNMTLHFGRETVTWYVEHLSALGLVITAAELILALFALVHVGMGLILYYHNFISRPVRYRVYKSGGGRTIGSRLQPYTGLTILVFLVVHLINFRLVKGSNEGLYTLVADLFARPEYVLLYVVGVIAVGLHVSHGFWSAFQTLGASHPKYSPIITGVGLLASVAFGLGFGLIPISMLIFR
jgi:succinate dehydrogenase / fumarate reductase cytochrome b subunit